MSTNPACFGISICYDPTSKTCKRCPVASSCAKAGKLELLEIASQVEVGDILKRFEGVEVRSYENWTTVLPGDFQRLGKPDRHESFVMTQLPGRDGAFAKLLARKGVDFSLLRAGIIQKELHLYPWLHEACLLLMENGFTRSELAAYFTQTRNWNEATARRYVTTTIRILDDAGVVEGSKYRIRLL